MHNTSDLAVIYIPGLFDHVWWVERAQQWAIRRWQKHGINTEIFSVGWANKDQFDPRLDALCERIDELVAQGKKVALVGASAGAAAVLGALDERPHEIARSVIICGKIHRPEIIPQVVFGVNEVFEDALEDTDGVVESLTRYERKNMLSLRSAVDAIVPPSDSIISGAHNIRMPVIGHLAGIAYALLVHGRFIARWCRIAVAEPNVENNSR